jgi:serine/threonine protein phosphatase PrpC
MADNFFGLTDKGRQRDNNEDAFIAQAVMNNRFAIACVIDGVGGYEGGEVAAAIAKETILERLSTRVESIVPAMKEAFALANERIYQARTQSATNNNMACVLTLAVVDVKNNKFYYAHIGDTRLYLLRDQSLVKVTKDQSFVGFLEDSGRLTEAEAMKHPKRNEINKALGFEADAINQADYIETGESPFLPADTILLCTDGLTDMINTQKIVSILSGRKPLQQKCERLIDAANDAGGKDNITVVLVHNTKRPVRQQANKPVLIKKSEMQKQTSESQTAFAPAKKDQVPGRKDQVRKSSSKSGVIVLLSLLCLLFLGAALWLWSKQAPSKQTADEPTKVRHEAEINLQNALDSNAGDTLVITEAFSNNPVFISDTLWIRKDSLYIKGNGLALLKDSSYTANNVAVMLAPNVRKVVFDSVLFSGFATAIVAPANAVELKNVVFMQCTVDVALQFGADSTFVNGRFARQLKQRRADTLPLIINQ